MWERNSLGIPLWTSKDEDPVPAPPKVTTGEISNITSGSASVTGEVVNDGNATISERGVVISESLNPTISDNKVLSGSGVGMFTANISGLIPGTTYHVRAFATNEKGTAYGPDKAFTTSATVPAVTTRLIVNIVSTSASSGGHVIDDGGVQVTHTGIVYGTSSNPTIANEKTNDVANYGKYKSTMSGLSPGVQYYVRAYATNSAGTAYGEELSFTTLLDESFTDSRDGTVYKIVKIGNQVWMRENLKFLPNVVDKDTYSATDPYFYVYGYNGTSVDEAKATENYNTYGVLYNWPALMGGATGSVSNPSGVQGVCPMGWHLPSDAEWTEITDYLDVYDLDLSMSVGMLMKEAGIVHWISPNVGATNESGFTALPAGHLQGDFPSFYYGLGEQGRWWSSTEDYFPPGKSFALVMSYNYGDAGRILQPQFQGLSARCLRD